MIVFWFLFFFSFAAQGKQTTLQILSPFGLSPDLKIVSDKALSFRASEEQGFILEIAPSVVYLVHPLSSSKNIDEIKIRMMSDRNLELTIIPNVTEGANYTFELQKNIKQSEQIQDYYFSVNHPNFKNAQDFGVKIIAPNGAKIVLDEIKFAQFNFSEKIFQTVRDYLRAAPYSGFTVNLFPTPRVFGREAFLYFLPVFVLFFSFILIKKYRKAGAIGLLVIWLVTDFRMNYEFARYQIEDQRGLKEQNFRTYGDFYAFASWLEKNLPKEADKLNFYYLENEHFPRLLQYYLYPVEIFSKGEGAGWYVVYHKKDIKERLIAEGGLVVQEYEDDSAILLK